MKKSIIIMLGLALMSVQSFADTRAQALLLHNGQGKSFDADQLQEAVNEAVDGDTIYLSEGTFNLNGVMTIEKNVSLVGAGGEKTTLRGSINFAIDGAPTITRHLLDALKITDALEVTKEQHGLNIRKCWIGTRLIASDDVTDLQIDRCYIDTIIPSAHFKSASVVNSVIAYIGYSATASLNPYPYNTAGNDWLFTNCSILFLYAHGYSTSSGNIITDAAFANCIVLNIDSSGGVDAGENNSYTNCLTSSNYGRGSTVHNCYSKEMNYTTNKSKDNYPSFIWGTTSIGVGNVSSLSSYNFFGTDGTVVGALGGATPYTLEAEGLEIKESLLRVDPDTRQLNVTLKVEKK